MGTDVVAEDVDLSPLSQLQRDLRAVQRQIEAAERSTLLRELCALDRERWGLVLATLADSLDAGAPGTVAAVFAVLDAAVGATSTTG